MNSYNTIVFFNCGKIKVMSIKRLTDKAFKSNKQINSTINIMNMPNQVLRGDNYSLIILFPRWETTKFLLTS